jgi:hypothetical protein
MMRNSLLAYLKGIMEGNEDLESWTTWISANQEALERTFSRGEYLRLKNTPIKEIRRLLEKHHVTYQEADHPVLPREQGQRKIPEEWLTEKVKPTTSPDYRVIEPRVGYAFADMIDMLLAKESDDELWHWDDGCGSSGLCLVRKGKPVFAISTRILLD